MSSVPVRTINSQQQAFAEAYVHGETAGNGAASAVAAGYSEIAARQEAYRLLRHEGVRAEIARLNREALGELATASIHLLGRVVKDEDASMKLRIDAAKTILDRAGYIAPKAAEPIEHKRKRPEQMTAEELEDFIQRARAQIAAAAKPVIDMTPALAKAESAADRT